jgi:hypothetical protein
MSRTATAMIAPSPEILLGEHDPEQLPLSLATEGVLRYVWQSAFGPILIEVREGVAFVNGEPVTPIADSERCGDEGDAPGPARPLRAV